MHKKTKHAAQDRYESCFIARQPIFTPSGSLWGYELLFRANSEANVAEIQNPAVATAQVLVDGVSLVFSGDEKRRKLLINIPPSLLDPDLLDFLPQRFCVLEVLEDVQPTPKILKAMADLKRLGYTMALDDYEGQEGLADILSLMDIIKVDFKAVPPHRRAALTQEVTRPGLMLLAEKVETDEDVQQARELGYHLLQGFFFQHPEIISGRKVAPSTLTKLRVLGLLARKDIEKPALLEIFAHNPQLTYRLLKFANSVAFYKTKELTSLQHAVSFIGTQNLRHWLLTVMLADGQSSDSKAELAFMAAVRAGFLQRVAKAEKLADADDLFMLGLFSLLDSLYDMPFDELMQDIPLDARVKVALAQGEGVLHTWLLTAIHLERGEFTQAEELLACLGVDVTIAMRCYRSALEWAQSSMH